MIGRISRTACLPAAIRRRQGEWALSFATGRFRRFSGCLVSSRKAGLDSILDSWFSRVRLPVARLRPRKTPAAPTSPTQAQERPEPARAARQSPRPTGRPVSRPPSAAPTATRPGGARASVPGATWRGRGQRCVLRGCRQPFRRRGCAIAEGGRRKRLLARHGQPVVRRREQAARAAAGRRTGRFPALRRRRTSSPAP